MFTKRICKKFQEILTTQVKQAERKLMCILPFPLLPLWPLTCAQNQGPWTLGQKRRGRNLWHQQEAASIETEPQRGVLNYEKVGRG